MFLVRLINPAGKPMAVAKGAGRMAKFRNMANKMHHEMGQHKTITMGFGTLVYLSVAGILLWQAIDECKIRPDADKVKRAARAPAKVAAIAPSIQLPGYQDVALAFFTADGKVHVCAERNMPNIGAKIGDDWPMPVRYDATNPDGGDATVRPFLVNEDDVKWMGGCCAVLLLYTFGPLLWG
jgi:hypothetical protein